MQGHAVCPRYFSPCCKIYSSFKIKFAFSPVKLNSKSGLNAKQNKTDTLFSVKIEMKETEVFLTYSATQVICSSRDLFQVSKPSFFFLDQLITEYKHTIEAHEPNKSLAPLHLKRTYYNCCIYFFQKAS